MTFSKESSSFEILDIYSTLLFLNQPSRFLNTEELLIYVDYERSIILENSFLIALRQKVFFLNLEQAKTTLGLFGKKMRW